jgi:cytidine deaminase
VHATNSPVIRMFYKELQELSLNFLTRQLTFLVKPNKESLANRDIEKCSSWLSYPALFLPKTNVGIGRIPQIILTNKPTNIPTFLPTSPCLSPLSIIKMSATVLQSSDPTHIAQICETYSITITQFDILQARSSAGKASAYCPYSNFRVGATILTEDGKYIDGANVENCSYPVGTCAERVAFGKAVTEGHRGFKAVAVATDISPPASPCGMCRQL